MSTLSERDIRDMARKLAESESFEPPAGLLEKIKAEIPPEIAVGTVVPIRARRSATPKQRWLIAASLVATVGAGLLGLRTWQFRERASLETESRSQDAAPQSDPAKTLQLRGPSEVLIPPPPPPPSPPRLSKDLAQAPAEQVQPAPPAAAAPAAKPQQEALRALGYIADSRADQRRQRTEPAAPVEVPQSLPAAPATRGRNLVLERDEEKNARKVENGVVGGVEGGVVGGSPAGALPQKLAQSSWTSRFNEQQEKKAKASEAYDAVLFKSAGTNPFVSAAAHPHSTFGLDVDTASYTVARRYLADGHLPEPASVRVEEWLNYFDYGDPAPARGDFAIRAEGAPSPFGHGPEYRLLRFNVKARQVKAASRRPAVLTFVIDISGSMAREDRLGLVKQSLSLLLDQLRAEDRVGLVVFGSHARLLLEPTEDRQAIRQAIQRLAPEGSTNTEEGLALGYDVAGRNFRMSGVNRIILCSDGVANVGTTGPEAILGRIGREARRGIELTTLGFGMGNYNDDLMEQLADKGEGRYAYVDTLDEARRVLVDELTGTLQTVAKNAKVQVEFNSVVVARYRLLGYENRAIPDERFRDETVPAGQVGAGHSVTALYEIELRKDAPHWEQPVATLHLRYQVPTIGTTTETLRRVGFQDFAPTWEQASPALRLAALVAELAEILKGSPWTHGDLGTVSRRLREVARQFPGNAKVTELVDLAARAARLKGVVGEE